MDENTKGYIRYIFTHETQNITRLAQKAGVSRKTVRRALKEELPARCAKPSKLDPFKPAIEQILSEHPLINNTGILEKLRAMGYDGGRSILSEYLLTTRKKNSGAFLHIETLPGFEAQADWAYAATISCGRHIRKLYLFSMVLSYSRFMYMRFTTSMDSDSFMASHIKAFRFFGGVPQTILYDNLKSVVTARCGKEISFNARFLDFASFYSFKPKVCNVRKANEKGKVERSIQYIKNSFLKSHNAENHDRLTTEASLWLRQVANQRIHSSTHKIPQEVLNDEEKAHLLLLPPHDYDYAQVRPCYVHKDCLFSFDANRYSVPAEYIHLALSFKAYVDEIRVIHQDKIIAVHKRSYDKYEVIKDLAHYAKLVEQKKKAQHQQNVDGFRQLCAEAEEYLKGLVHSQTQPLYHVKKILSLEVVFGRTAVAGAIAHALSFKAFHWEFIKNILLKSSPVQQQIMATLPNKDELMSIKIKPVNLARYDELLKEAGDES